MLSLASARFALGTARFSAAAAEVLAALREFRLAAARVRADAAIQDAETRIAGIVAHDEHAANLGRLLVLHFGCLSSVAQFWHEALDGHFRAAWDYLIDAENAIRTIHRNSTDAGSHGLLALAEQLELVQRLYPYSVFSSMEMLASAEQCSACGLSPWDPACQHRAGEIAKGQVVYITVQKAKLIGLAITSRPKDKRLVILPTQGSPDYSRVEALIAAARSPLVRLVVQARHRMSIDGEIDLYGPGTFPSVITR